MDSDEVQIIDEVNAIEIENESKRKDAAKLVTMLKIPAGSDLIFIKDSSIVCKVIGDKHVEFEGSKFSLSGLAYKLLTEKYNWSKNSAANGFWHFSYEGEVLGERRQRLENEKSDIED